MTISSTTVKQVFAGGGTTFAVPFTFTANSQVKVYELDDSVTPYTVTLQVEGGGSDYTIVGTNVVFNSATAATSRIVIIRSTVLTQTFDPDTTQYIDVNSLETELDKIVKMVQELDERVDRAAVMPLGSTLSSIEIPEVEDNAGKALVVNSDEDGLEWSSTVVDVVNSASVDNRMLKSDGTGGNIQQTGISVDDSDNVTGIRIDANGTGNVLTNIGNAEIKTAAGIAHNKMAALTPSRAVVTDADGFAGASATTAAEILSLAGITGVVNTRLAALEAQTVNYCTNGTAETDTTGWATYADAAATTPANGTGGAANITWTRSTSSPLRGTASFLLTKDAVNRQGEGVSFDFTLQNADVGNLVGMYGEYEVSSAYASSDISLHVYDVTGAALEVVYGNNLLSDPGTNAKQRFYLEYKPNTGSAAARFIIHIASTNASAYTVKFDNITILPIYKEDGDIEILVDSKTANTAGGTFTSGAARTRTLTNQLHSEQWCTLASDQFTLAPGRYFIQAWAPAYRVDRHKAYLYSTTDAAIPTNGTGSSEFSANAAAYTQSFSYIACSVVITSSKTYEIRHWCETTQASSGFGVASNLNSMAEIYTKVIIQKFSPEG